MSNYFDVLKFVTEKFLYSFCSWKVPPHDSGPAFEVSKFSSKDESASLPNQGVDSELLFAEVKSPSTVFQFDFEKLSQRASPSISSSIGYGKFG